MKLTIAASLLAASLLLGDGAEASPENARHLNTAFNSGTRPMTPHRAVYKVKIKVVSGRLDTELKKTDGGYVAHHVIKPTGMARLLTRGTMDVTSVFESGTLGVRPIAFKSVDTIRDDPDVDLNFDWTQNEAAGRVGEEDVVFELDGVSHDSVSIQYQLMHDLLNGGPSERYTLFDIDGLQIAEVTNIGSKQVKTKAGKYTAVGIQHQKEGSSRTTTLWCVEDLDYLPVIIEQHRKGKLNFRAKLVRYSPSDV